MGTEQADDGDHGFEHGGSKQRKRKFTLGLLALLLLILNALVVIVVYLASGGGVDSGIGLGLVIVFFSFPLALFTVFLGILSVTGKRGRIPGSIALGITSAALLFVIYGFLDTQVF